VYVPDEVRLNVELLLIVCVPVGEVCQYQRYPVGGVPLNDNVLAPHELVDAMGAGGFDGLLTVTEIAIEFGLQHPPELSARI
jgi:hypothetical protein